MEGKKLIKAILLVIMMSFSVNFISFSVQDVMIEIKDMGKTDEKWYSSRSPDPLQFKHFEAIVQDSSGKQYAIAASVAGNKYMYEAHAWLASADEWYEIYRETPEIKSSGYDIWTKGGELAFRGNIGAGWQIDAEGKEAAFEVVSTPERPISQYSVVGSSADFDGYISFRTKVNGKIMIGRRSIDVEGLGYCLHTFGDMGKHIKWRYAGFKDEKLCITAMDAQFGDDQLNMFVTVDDGRSLSQYKQDKVLWNEPDQNTWQISAASDETSKTHLEMNIRLVKPRPTNKDQPYSRYSLGFITLSRTILHEYLAEIEVTVKNPDGQIELKSLGIATVFDLTR